MCANQENSWLFANTVVKYTYYAHHHTNHSLRLAEVMDLRPYYDSWNIHWNSNFQSVIICNLRFRCTLWLVNWDFSLNFRIVLFGKYKQKCISIMDKHYAHVLYYFLRQPSRVAYRWHLRPRQSPVSNRRRRARCTRNFKKYRTRKITNKN